MLRHGAPGRCRVLWVGPGGVNAKSDDHETIGGMDQWRVSTVVRVVDVAELLDCGCRPKNGRAQGKHGGA